MKDETLHMGNEEIYLNKTIMKHSKKRQGNNA